MAEHIEKCNFAVAMSNNNTNGVSLFEGWAFGKINYILFAFGVSLLLVGYALMATGSVNSFQSLTLAPILLFLGYVIVIPFSLVYRLKK
ncbi:MAG: DUF3098 domain-containing protein [Candidatus Marinimicrobia bacterium]|nr:DUF3098 domain-containing protein [Candidatus Neomarinimicrobiota bacterium]MBT3763174.1 DUF3098 domain-containing protein [Candidatus Neomarinimicrobiota bacterium]MBT4270799.1 DUF3098 domain-containing protein [Candidatus Neomarinimicrobiota bacterium]MBT4809872.1 DUF3098 domain-containing protein [Candidatus Neomarinimicrobiota bacterium]MBT6129205.1 DUF3098 domain-containing protein [Candidatus Neomarinimicrobiota bacterium]